MTVAALFEMPGLNSIGTAAAVCAVFALLARWLRGVTTSGAIAGALISFVLYAGLGLPGFVVLVALFALTWLATRVGYRQKQNLGTAEPPKCLRIWLLLLFASSWCGLAENPSGYSPLWPLWRKPPPTRSQARSANPAPRLRA